MPRVADEGEWRIREYPEESRLAVDQRTKRHTVVVAIRQMICDDRVPGSERVLHDVRVARSTMTGRRAGNGKRLEVEWGI